MKRLFLFFILILFFSNPVLATGSTEQNIMLKCQFQNDITDKFKLTIFGQPDGVSEWQTEWNGSLLLQPENDLKGYDPLLLTGVSIQVKWDPYSLSAKFSSDHMMGDLRIRTTENGLTGFLRVLSDHEEYHEFDLTCQK